MMSTRSDLHLHTLVSDGTTDALTLLEAAREAGLQRISFTDHDAVGAYRHFHPDIIGLARSLGIELIPGIELDSQYKNREVHLLGYDIDIDDPALNAHLELTQRRRKEKVCLQIEAINSILNHRVIEPEEVILPHRDTLMKPHLVHGLLATGQWGDDYKAAQNWLVDTVSVSVKVPKLPIADAIALVHGAGGRAVLAHPGFLSVEQGMDLETVLSELKTMGLDGVETEYAYAGAKSFPNERMETEIIDQIRCLAERLALFTTRGSDAHDPQKLKDFSLRHFS